jgi:hypothetical protein
MWDFEEEFDEDIDYEIANVDEKKSEEESVYDEMGIEEDDD